MISTLKKTVCIVLFAFVSSFGYSQSKDYICKATSYAFGLWDASKDGYLWTSESESNLIIFFSDKVIDIYSDPTQTFFKEEVIFREQGVVTYRATDKDGYLCHVCIVDTNPNDQVVALLVRYSLFAYFYNFYIVR